MLLRNVDCYVGAQVAVGEVSLHWQTRLREWRTVLATKGVKVSTWALVRAVLSGLVPADVWRDRMRVCLRCPIYNREMKACHRVLADGRTVGCGCYAPFKALTAAPYTYGCWGQQTTQAFRPTERIGWVDHEFTSRWAKIRAVWRFIFNLQ